MYKNLLGLLLGFISLSGFVNSINLTAYPIVNNHCTTKQNSTDLFCSKENYAKASKKVQIVLGNRMRSQGSNDFEKKLNILETKVKSLYREKGISILRRAYLEITLLYVDQYQNNTVDVGPLMNELFGNNNNTNTVTSETISMPVLLQLNIGGLFPRWSEGKEAGFGVRFSTRDINENSINPVVQGTVPKGYCLEFNSIPLDFAYVRNQKGIWISYDDWKNNYYYGNEEGYKILYCGVTDFKILLPKKQNFFDSGFGIGFINLTEEKIYPACTRLVFSADNGQYVENSFCVQDDLSKGEGYVRVTIEDGIKKGVVKVTEL